MNLSSERLINAALACLLLSSVYHAFSLIIQAHIWIGLPFFVSSGLCAKVLTEQNNYNSQLVTRHRATIKSLTIALGSTWLAFFFYIAYFAFSSQLFLHFEWLYLLIFSTYLIVPPHKANAIVITSLSLIALLLVLLNAPINVISDILPISVFSVVFSLVATHIRALTHALDNSQTTDLLTGCANPNQLKKEIKNAVELHQRYSTSVSCLTLSYKLKFDQYPQFETWIKELTQVCQSRLRNTDTLCRYSDSKLIIVLPNTKKESAQSVGNDLVSACKAYDFSYFKKPQKQEAPDISNAEFEYDVSDYNGQESWESWLQKITA